MTEPTQEQIKEFWERFGFEKCLTKHWEKWDSTYGKTVSYAVWCSPKEEIGELPPINLNSIFKYAVPKLIEKLGTYEANCLLNCWIDTVVIDRVEPAPTLFWALWQVKGVK